MEAKEFLTGLKASGSDRDWVVFDDALLEYQRLARAARGKEACLLAVNVLCVMCRNLEKVPKWTERADPSSMLRLCAFVLADIGDLSASERTRMLAALYHLHRHATRQKVPPELVFKLSAYAFKYNPNDLLKEYCKTYWAILADRLTYIEKLKQGKRNINKLIPSLTGDVIKTILVYDTANFCTDNLLILIKKLYHIFSEIESQDLDALYNKIYEAFLAKDNLKECTKKFTDDTILDLYKTVIDGFSVVVENSSKCKFVSCALTTGVRFAITLLGHRSDICHCLDAFYKNGYCMILGKNDNHIRLLKEMVTSIETFDKVGYKTIAKETYPYLNQVVRTHIEWMVHDYDKKQWSELLPIETQETYLDLIASFMKKLSQSPQIVNCHTCDFKSGLHDALRLSFSVCHFVTNSLKHNMDIIQTLPRIYEAIDEQKSIINELRRENCPNAEKCRIKMQTDMHNNAILLYTSKYYEYSNKLFETYIRSEIAMYASTTYSERSSLSRAFYNKAICELDMSLFETALRSAFLSLAFADEDGLERNKYMCLVIDVKSKALKSKQCEDETNKGNENELQMMSVWDAWRTSCETNEYGDLKPLLRPVLFCKLLLHEFSRYACLWPSLLPIAGVWGSLSDLLNSKEKALLLSERYECFLWKVCEVALRTPCVARTVYHERIGRSLADLIKKLEASESRPLHFKVTLATLLFLKAEFDLHEAKTQYGWSMAVKSNEPNKDDSPSVNQTIKQEHRALRMALRAVDLWSCVLPKLRMADVTEAPLRTALCYALRIASVFVVQLLHYERTTQALQLALVCVDVAMRIKDWVHCARNLGVLLSESLEPCVVLESYMRQVNEVLECLLGEDGSKEAALCYMCDAALYHHRSSQPTAAATLLRYVQLYAISSNGESLDHAAGRLLQVQQHVGTDDIPCLLSGRNAAHRHYLSMKSSGAMSWCERRLHGALTAYHGAATGERSVGSAAHVMLCKRARASAASALRLAGAARQARLHAMLTVPSAGQASDVQVKIDTIKSILDIKPLKISASTTVKEATNNKADNNLKNDVTSKSYMIEAVLDATVFKKTKNEPTSPYFDVPAFVMPDYLSHKKNCDCFACQNPWYGIVALEAFGIEASTYFRNGEVAIAKNYFEGVFKMFDFASAKICHFIKECGYKYDNFVLKIAKDYFFEHLKKTKVKILMEFAYLKMAEGDLENAIKYTKETFEINNTLNEKDPYVDCELINLDYAINYLNMNVSRTDPEELSLERELENLKLSPTPRIITADPKTPEVKVPSPKVSKPKIVINKDELPNVKRKVIKFNLADKSHNTKETVKPECKTKKFFKSKCNFKVPDPKTSQAVPEVIAPKQRISKFPISKLKTSKPLDIVISDNKSKHQIPKIKTTKYDKENSQAMKDEAESNSATTDRSEEAEEVFFTPMTKFINPISSHQQFFTPMSTTLKTYARNTLERQVLKNYEPVFFTPKPIEAPIIAEIPSIVGKTDSDKSSNSSDVVTKIAKVSDVVKKSTKRVNAKVVAPNATVTKAVNVSGLPRNTIRSNAKVSKHEPVFFTPKPIEAPIIAEIPSIVGKTDSDKSSNSSDVVTKIAKVSDVVKKSTKCVNAKVVAPNATVTKAVNVSGLPRNTIRSNANVSKQRLDKIVSKYATSPGKKSEDLQKPKVTGRPTRTSRIQQLQKK